MDDRINPYAAPQAYQEPIPVAAATLTPLRRGLRIFLGIVLLLLALICGGIVAARISNLGIRLDDLPTIAVVATLSLALLFVGLWMLGWEWFRLLGKLSLAVLLLFVIAIFSVLICGPFIFE